MVAPVVSPAKEMPQEPTEPLVLNSMLLELIQTWAPGFCIIELMPYCAPKRMVLLDIMSLPLLL
jgi:hypothetical protein